VKFDDQLAAYLYQKKSLRLEGIGTFMLDGKASVPHAQEKEVYYPIEGLSFVYNPKTDTEEEVILFLVQKLHKIQPLIRSDLESYLSNVRQFINLGKPYTIEGIGTLTKNNQGTFEFTPGSFLPAKEELNPRRENAEHNYPVRSQFSAGRVFVIILVVLAALAALGGIGWGISHLLSKSQQASVEDEPQTGRADTLTQQPNSDTSVYPPPAASSGAPASENPGGDSAMYKMFFETTRSKQRADKRTEQLNRLHFSYAKVDTVRTGETVFYKMYVPVKISNADTAYRLRRIKDSLRIFFGKRIIAERQ
jgi:hypothetical protein